MRLSYLTEEYFHSDEPSDRRRADHILGLATDICGLVAEKGWIDRDPDVETIYKNLRMLKKQLKNLMPADGEAEDITAHRHLKLIGTVLHRIGELKSSIALTQHGGENDTTGQAAMAATGLWNVIRTFLDAWTQPGSSAGPEVDSLRGELEAAIEAGNYEAAAQIRDKINAIFGDGGIRA